MSSAQRVETNRQKIVDAGTKVKTLRQMKADKRKKTDAFYFIHTEAAVDNRAHLEHLDLDYAEVPSDEAASVENEVDAVVKVSKSRNMIESNSSSDEMFPADCDTAEVDDAAKSAADAAKTLLNSPLVHNQLEQEYGNNNVPFVGVEHFGNAGDINGLDNEGQDESSPNFDVIFYELNKLASSNEVVDVKTRLLKLKQTVEGESGMSSLHADVQRNEDGHSGKQELNVPNTVTNVVVDPTTNMLMAQQQQDISKFMIVDQFGHPNWISLPSQSTFMVQNSMNGNYFLAPVGGAQVNSAVIMQQHFQNALVPNPIGNPRPGSVGDVSKRVENSKHNAVPEMPNPSGKDDGADHNAANGGENSKTTGNPAPAIPPTPVGEDSEADVPKPDGANAKRDKGDSDGEPDVAKSDETLEPDIVNPDGEDSKPDPAKPCPSKATNDDTPTSGGTNKGDGAGKPDVAKSDESSEPDSTGKGDGASKPDIAKGDGAGKPDIAKGDGAGKPDVAKSDESSEPDVVNPDSEESSDPAKPSPGKPTRDDTLNSNGIGKGDGASKPDIAKGDGAGKPDIAKGDGAGKPDVAKSDESSEPDVVNLDSEELSDPAKPSPGKPSSGNDTLNSDGTGKADDAGKARKEGDDMNSGIRGVPYTVKRDVSNDSLNPGDDTAKADAGETETGKVDVSETTENDNPKTEGVTERFVNFLGGKTVIPKPIDVMHAQNKILPLYEIVRLYLGINRDAACVYSSYCNIKAYYQKFQSAGSGERHFSVCCIDQEDDVTIYVKTGDCYTKTSPVPDKRVENSKVNVTKVLKGRKKKTGKAASKKIASKNKVNYKDFDSKTLVALGKKLAERKSGYEYGVQYDFREFFWEKEWDDIITRALSLSSESPRKLVPFKKIVAAADESNQSNTEEYLDSEK